MTELQMVKMKTLCSLVGEQFSDFLLIVRPDSKGLSWRSSDSTWALGAATRYIQGVKMGDTLEQADDYRHGGQHG